MTFFVDTQDARNSYVKKLLIKKNYTTETFTSFNNCKQNDITIFAPNKKFENKEIEKLPENITIICGNIPDEQTIILTEKNIRYINLLEDEIFAIQNSKLTTEGILANILEHSPKSIFENKILILGNGRVGKATAQLFNKLNLNFSIASHDKINYSLAYLFSENNYFGNKIYDNIDKFDVIINTIPAKIFPKNQIKKIKNNALFLEIASQETISNASTKHFSYIKCPALPQKFSAETAGKFMFECILRMLK